MREVVVATVGGDCGIHGLPQAANKLLQLFAKTVKERSGLWKQLVEACASMARRRRRFSSQTPLRKLVAETVCWNCL
jgi:hypothetical protein